MNLALGVPIVLLRQTLIVHAIQDEKVQANISNIFKCR